MVLKCRQLLYYKVEGEVADLKFCTRSLRARETLNNLNEN